MTIDVSALANAVIDGYWPKFVRLPFANRTVFDFPSSPYALEGLEDGPEENAPRGLLPIVGPEAHFDNFEVLSSTTHAATEMTEYGVPGATGADTFTEATPGVISAWIPVQITGFAIDRLVNAGRSEGDIIGWSAKKFATAFKQLGDYINGVLLGSTAKGLVGALDDTVSYAGINPAVVTNWASYVNDDGGLISTAILDDVWFSTTGGDRQANEQDLVWLAPSNQVKRYKQIGDMLKGNSEVQRIVLSNGEAMDLGATGFSYMGRPIVSIPDLSTTDILLYNTSESFIQETRSLQVVAKPYAGDGELFYVSWRGKLMIPNRHQNGKAEGLTA